MSKLLENLKPIDNLTKEFRTGPKSEISLKLQAAGGKGENRAFENKKFSNTSP